MENAEDEALKFENELEKLKMKAELGASFFEGNADLPPEIEAQWLKNVRAYEENYENMKPQKIRDVLGDPTLIPVSEISDENIEAELERMKELMGSKGIILDHDKEVPMKELYRFIVDEMMDHETDMFDMPGWQTHIIYEEFYPNHEKDILDRKAHV